MPSTAASPRPPAGEVRGEEGIEDAGQDGGIDTGARVGDLEGDVGSWSQIVFKELLVQAGFVKLFRRGADSDGAGLVADGLDGVEDEVRDELLDLAGIGCEFGQGAGEFEPDLDVRRNAVTQQADRFSHGAGELNGGQKGAALSGVSEHLAREGGGLVRAVGGWPQR